MFRIDQEEAAGMKKKTHGEKTLEGNEENEEEEEEGPWSRANSHICPWNERHKFRSQPEKSPHLTVLWFHTGSHVDTSVYENKRKQDELPGKTEISSILIGQKYHFGHP
ncbi:hypothetical protein RUM44_000654 [Polyplax serrata]|uniref:Uncharacterized protein n=1 Tax=Polyplax serrata TaxID=468196 RepID=A0ABR1B5Z4_POLSC